MTPRLLLLTGPAAGDVAAVLSDEAASHYPATGTFGLSIEEIAQAQADERAAVGWWDEVRDYRAAIRTICCCQDAEAEQGLDWTCGHAEKAIRSLPGGEAWLVGLVLPEVPFQSVKWGHKNDVVATQDYGLGRVRQTFDIVADPHFSHGPARLAILAPDPPPLLVERVRSWGGEVWKCEIAPPEYGKPDSCWIVLDNDVPSGTTWPEAVRAALGES